MRCPNEMPWKMTMKDHCWDQYCVTKWPQRQWRWDQEVSSPQEKDNETTTLPTEIRLMRCDMDHRDINGDTRYNEGSSTKIETRSNKDEDHGDGEKTWWDNGKGTWHNEMTRDWSFQLLLEGMLTWRGQRRRRSMRFVTKRLSLSCIWHDFYTGKTFTKKFAQVFVQYTHSLNFV